VPVGPGGSSRRLAGALRELAPAQPSGRVRRGRQLNRLTIGWNGVEGIVAVTAGLAAGSVSLVGFGLDSGIEVSAATSPCSQARR
jgi:hypothetical protein